MADDFDTDHEFLELRDTDYTSRTFMGGTRLSTRIALFLVTGLAAIAAFGGLYWYVDREVDRAIDHFTRVEAMAGLIQHVDRGLARLRGHEKQFLLTKDAGIAEAFGDDVENVNAALATLFESPAAQGLQQDIATVRDGIGQYEEQFRDRVRREKALGINDGTGLSGKLRRTSNELKDRFRALDLANLADQVERIDQQGKETLLSGYRRGVEELRQRYRTLGAFLDTAELAPERRQRLTELLAAHETDMLALINARFTLSAEAERFDELTDYVQPSMQSLAAAAERRRIEAGADLRKMQLFARYTVAGGSLAILLWLLLIGLILLRSVVTPARQLAYAAGELARGARTPGVPARGNADSFGVIARSFDTWMDALVDLDRTRRELDRTRERLDQLAAREHADAAAHAAADSALEAGAGAAQESLSRGAEEAAPAGEPAADAPSRGVASRRSFHRDDALTLRPAGHGQDEILRGGPIASISAQLQNFSQYVTAAANDVERTEGLIRGLEEANRLLGDLADAVADVRDQSNMLAFRAPDEDSAETAGPVAAGEADGHVARRLDAIREATSRAERTLEEVQNALDGAGDTAQDIAEQASEQALEATHKLLSQSEYLQSMLDDILGKLHPGDERRQRRVARPDEPAGAIADLNKHRRGPGGPG